MAAGSDGKGVAGPGELRAGWSQCERFPRGNRGRALPCDRRELWGGQEGKDPPGLHQGHAAQRTAGARSLKASPLGLHSGFKEGAALTTDDASSGEGPVQRGGWKKRCSALASAG